MIEKKFLLDYPTDITQKKIATLALSMTKLYRKLSHVRLFMQYS